jgi:VWFA-related protein
LGRQPFRNPRLSSYSELMGLVLKNLLFITSFLSLCLLPYLAGQEKGPETGRVQSAERQEASESTIKVPVNSVVVKVTVNDHKGNSVEDLAREDFKVYEDGRLRPIQTFSAESSKRLRLEETINDGNRSSQLAAQEKPTGEPSDLLAFVIDDLTDPSSADLYRALEAVKKTVAQNPGPLDRMSVLLASGRSESPFSDDRDFLERKLTEISRELTPIRVMRSSCPQLSDEEAYVIKDHIFQLHEPPGSAERRPDTKDLISGMPIFLQSPVRAAMVCLGTDDLRSILHLVRSAAIAQSEQAESNNRMLLATLRQLTQSLRTYKARKTIVLLSSGFIAEGLLYEMQGVIEAALRQGVILNTIDIRGLYTTSLNTKDSVSVTEKADLLARRQQAIDRDMEARQGPLYQLATDTGGFFFHNNNDLGGGLNQILQREACCYVLTYASALAKPDGRYHKIRLEVLRPGVTLSYRKGYYAEKEMLAYENHNEEEILRAFEAAKDLGDIPVQVSYDCRESHDGQYELAVLTRVDLTSVPFQEENERFENQFDIAYIALDENDRYVNGLRKGIEFHLTRQNYASLKEFGLSSKSKMTLPPGRYRVKIVVRESVHKKIGSSTKVIQIPESQ